VSVKTGQSQAEGAKFIACEDGVEFKLAHLERTLMFLWVCSL
jgi:hypothetical protein